MKTICYVDSPHEAGLVINILKDNNFHPMPLDDLTYTSSIEMAGIGFEVVVPESEVYTATDFLKKSCFAHLLTD